MAEIAVLGAGAWGTALAVSLARHGHSVILGVRRPEQLREMVASGQNRTYLAGVPFPHQLELRTDWSGFVTEAKVVVMATPSRFARATIVPIAHVVRGDARLVSVTKGIEQDSLLTMSQLLAAIAPQVSQIAVLSGPGFALEIACGKPAALVAAAREESLAREIQQIFATPAIRIYRSSDMLGVELGGAVKNVIAIAAGICDGLALGSSARAALITRGVAEIMRLAEVAGARSETIAGLAGLGDLVLTCTGDLSRNRAAGLALARGDPRISEQPGAPIAEGIANAESVRALAQRLKVEMPIVSAVYRVLYENAPPRAMVEELLSRELKAEFR
jgi:glycerol-3-phosphate dehydrogenase (NAD(P)+)